MFYDRFIELCRKSGVKPTPLVMQMGLSSSNVSQWKKGSTPRPEVLKRLADYFNVSVEYLLESDQKEKPATQEGGELSDEDIEVIELLRAASPSKKAALLALLKE